MTVKLEFDLMVISGELNLLLKYNKKAYEASTMEHIADAFFNNIGRILKSVKEEELPNLTPADFDTVSLDQEDLNTLFQ